MFTGIIQHCAKVIACEKADTGIGIRIDITGWAHTPSHGDSIAVNGCCLTVADIDSKVLRFDVVHQTLRQTTIGEFRSGDLVNVEHAVTPSTLMGGHVVQGHVDGIGVVMHMSRASGEVRMRVEPPPTLMEFIVERGSVAIDGVSLTVATTGETWFEVALIPTTLEQTTLGHVRDGDRVNLEADYLARIMVEWLKRRGV